MWKEEITLALISQVLRYRDKDYNLSRMEQVIAAEAPTGIDLFLFPESNINGGLWKDMEADCPSSAEPLQWTREDLANLESS